MGVVEELREAGFALCSDLCAVDYLQHPDRQLPEHVEAERFEVVVNLTSLTRSRRVRIRVQVPEADPRLPDALRLLPRDRGDGTRRPTTCTGSSSTTTRT